MDDDILLIQRLIDGDESALSILIERHKAPLFRLAYRYTHNPTDAADITEETFVRLYFNAHRFKPKSTVSSWLFTIAANLCKDHLRRQKKNAHFLVQPTDFNHPASPYPTSSDYLGTHSSTPATELNTEETLAEIHAAIHALPHKLKFPFIFCTLEAHSYDACAQILKTNRKTIETRIYRARQQLRKQLAHL